MDFKQAFAVGIVGFSVIASTTLAEVQEYKDCLNCPVVTVIPAGVGSIGSTEEEATREHLPMMGPNDIGEWERPIHKVTISTDFALGKYEITTSQFAFFVNESGYRPRKNCESSIVDNSSKPKNEYSWEDPGFAQDDSHPVVCVSWTDIWAYTDWLTEHTGHQYRLPSEAEWEYAARAGTRTARYWGDGVSNACQYANAADESHLERYDGHTFLDIISAHGGNFHLGLAKSVPCKDGHVETAPVGSFQPNAFGLFDTLGNVWEAVEDCFHPNYVGAPTDGSAWVDRKTCDRAPQYSSELVRIFKGGSFSYPPYGLRSSRRGKGGLDRRSWNRGFRVVREID